MATHDHDKHFFNQFGIVMGALLIIFAICIVAARWVAPKKVELEPAELALIQERLAPVGKVITDPAALVAAAPKVERAPMSGEQVVEKICSACHATGVLGAPKDGDKATWQARLTAAGGEDGLVKHAIEGKNSMPPRGGDPSLSDDEIRGAIEKMLADAGL